LNLIYGGFEALTDYASAHVLTCLIPAFFIAGAISVFISQASVVKYFGAKTNKFIAYSIASISGTVLAVCSCTILPLFAGIRQRGAGLGPATTFLYSGPAINILAIIYSARLLGFDLGIARAVSAILFSIMVGLVMSAIFKREEKKLFKDSDDIDVPRESGKTNLLKTAVFFFVMVILLVAASSIGLKIWIKTAETGNGIMTLSGKIIPAVITIIFIALTIFLTIKWHSREERTEWMSETWKLFAKLFPLLLIGVFAAGIIRQFLPEPVVQKWVGGNTIFNNLLASVFGALMYFSTLTEVPIVKALTELGMGKGPALSLLLAGPSLSLPNMIVISRVMGVKRTAAYVMTVIIMSAAAGLIFGAFFS